MRHFTLLILTTLLLSCSTKISDLEKALIYAAENRPELEKVLNHYSKNPDDNLKYKSAVFLIENMPYHYYYEGDLLDRYSNIYEEMMRVQEPDVVVESFRNKYGAFSSQRLKLCEDIKYITSDFLINNIEFGFKVWEEQPWGKNVSFDDFCMYILPYRVNIEQPVEWRQYLYDKYNPLLDSLRKNGEASDPLAAARIIMDALCLEEKFFTTSMEHIPLRTPLLIEKHRAASCRNMADLTVYVLRALGIPSGIEYLPIHGRVNAGHCWTFILDKDGNTFTSDYLNCPIIPAVENLHFTAKIYRETFNINTAIRDEVSKFKNQPAPYLRYPKFIDVTELYCKEKSHSFSIPDTFRVFNNKENIAYLCTSHLRDWHPIDMAKIENGKITFDKLKWDYYFDRDTLMSGLTKEAFAILPDPVKDYIETIVFRLAYWNNGRMEYLTDPFTVDKNNNIVFIKPDEEDKNQICVFSKFDPLSDGFVQFLPDGVFEASNDKNFNNADTLFQIKEIPFRLFNIQSINVNKKYRYIRYKGADNSDCSISEIQVFEDSNILKGTPYGYIVGDAVKDHTYEKAFDGDPYTSFYSPNNSGDWVAIDLGRPCDISKIIFTPRNRDNFIRIDDRYELFYLKANTWNSLGMQTATSDSLIFESVPSNSLLYLKNHTRGNDERIFIYKDGVQVFL